MGVQKKIKRDGVYRARLVACRYNQIPRVDFNEIPHCTVINDITYRIMLVLSGLKRWSNVLGSITLILMSAAAVALIYFQFK